MSSITVLLYQYGGGGIIRTADVARTIAHAIVSGLNGLDYASDQLPFEAVRDGDTWVVTGCHELEHKRFKVVLRKDDCRVVDLVFPPGEGQTPVFDGDPSSG